MAPSLSLSGSTGERSDPGHREVNTLLDKYLYYRIR
jgi:hypothetical protein